MVNDSIVCNYFKDHPFYMLSLGKLRTDCRVRCGSFEFCDSNEQKKFAARYHKNTSS